jgi:signal transduction histidine kinase
VAERLARAVADLEETIAQIRVTIFSLQGPRLRGRSVRGEILAIATEASASLGFQPRLHLDGPIDTVVDEASATHVLAVLRETLSNVARHAGASAATVDVVVRDGLLSVDVADDGVGPGVAQRVGGQGLANLRRRAESLGGTLQVGPRQDRPGTRVTWTVTLPPG